MPPVLVSICMAEQVASFSMYTGLLTIEGNTTFLFTKKKIVEVGAIKASLEFLRCQQCEEVASWLLEALFNNNKV